MVLNRTGNDIRIPLLVRYVYCKSAVDSFQYCKYGMAKDGQCSGYHVPATRKRDLFYAKLEKQREENQSSV